MKSFLKAHVHQNCFAQASQGIQGRFEVWKLAFTEED